MYKAVARMKDDDHEWDVLIYSMYETVEEAERSSRRFLEKYNNDDSRVHCLYVQLLSAKKGEAKQMKLHKYATLYREPGPGAIPTNGLQYCEYERFQTPKGHFAWGTAVYRRELSEQEIEHYELEYVGVASLIDFLD